MQTFDDDEDAYLDWVARNPHGYVVNVQRTLNPNDVLHSASCKSISGAHSNYTTHEYIKVCSLARTELEQWAEGVVGGVLTTHRYCVGMGPA